MPEFRPSLAQRQRAAHYEREFAAKRIAGVAKGYKPSLAHLLGDEMLAGPQQNMMLVGGSRSGKTFTVTKAKVARGLKAPQAKTASPPPSARVALYTCQRRRPLAAAHSRR